MSDAIITLLPENAPDDEILSAVRSWVELLAADNFEAGYAMLQHYPNEPWAPDFLRMWISNYGWHDPMKDGSTFRVTSWKTATGREKHYQDVVRYDSPAADHSLGDVHFDLPLNGEWSDLTAIFSFFNHAGFLVLQLDDVHVL